MSITRFYSEYGEDRFIAENIDLPDNGFYVDVGAAHPTHTSNTAFLRDRGWGGVAIDGNPWWRDSWAGVARFVEAVIYREGRQVGFHVDMLQSRIVEANTSYPDWERSMGIRLDDVLWKNCKHEDGLIDFMSLDIEGSEFDAISTFPFHAQQPRIIVSEYNTAGIGEDMRVHDLLIRSHGYSLVHKTVTNHIFLKS